MKLYLHTNGVFYERQADCPSRKFETVEFPFAASPKADFVAWMNQNAGITANAMRDDGVITSDGLFDPKGEMRLEELPVDRHVREQSVKPAPGPREPRPIPNADAVVEFVLNEASPADIENVFSALGARFHEAIRR